MLLTIKINTKTMNVAQQLIWRQFPKTERMCEGCEFVPLKPTIEEIQLVSQVFVYLSRGDTATVMFNPIFKSSQKLLFGLSFIQLLKFKL